MEKISAQSVFICGMMGSGKSTVGKILAKQLNVPFQDLDSLIAEESGMTIPEIFEKKGEAGFRSIERNLVLKESQSSKGVLALGGGSLQNQQVVDQLIASGQLIFLKVSQSVLLDRLSSEQHRPLLKNSKSSRRDLQEKISQLIDERLPFYSQAQIIVEAEGKTPQKIAEELTQKLKDYEG